MNRIFITVADLQEKGYDYNFYTVYIYYMYMIFNRIFITVADLQEEGYDCCTPFRSFF